MMTKESIESSCEEEQNFMVEWDYTYTIFDSCSCGCDRHQTQETRTTGKQFQSLNEVTEFIKKNVFNKNIRYDSIDSIRNIKVFKLNKLEVKLDFENGN